MGMDTIMGMGIGRDVRVGMGVGIGMGMGVGVPGGRGYGWDVKSGKPARKAATKPARKRKPSLPGRTSLSHSHEREKTNYAHASVQPQATSVGPLTADILDAGLGLELKKSEITLNMSLPTPWGSNLKLSGLPLLLPEPLPEPYEALGGYGCARWAWVWVGCELSSHGPAT